MVIMIANIVTYAKEKRGKEKRVPYVYKYLHPAGIQHSTASFCQFLPCIL